MSDGNLRQVFRANLPEFFFTAIETGSTGRGVPDDHYVHAGQTGWIEYKLTTANAVGLHPEQVAWHERYARSGGRSFIAVRRRRSHSPRLIACDELFLFPGAAARALKQEGLKTSPGLIWMGENGPKNWPWEGLKGLLLGKSG